MILQSLLIPRSSQKAFKRNDLTELAMRGGALSCMKITADSTSQPFKADGASSSNSSPVPMLVFQPDTKQRSSKKKVPTMKDAMKP
ncbi:hypothetical protein AVEN_71397-1 [Araneus ventricosus]|uniref:Uncharacterized protein n=1 Tax=Araneus ventricosus TaxID=182803 RepID=A0A4Y2BHL7_ARAVE|nr:hypothetical protein AVEN_71397-1 [Araneus ventricosus]